MSAPTNYKTIINKSAEEVWHYLTDSIYHPAKYAANVNNCSIIEHHEDYVLRKIYTEFSYKERIEIDYPNSKLKFIFIDHPKFRGCTNYQLKNKSAGICELSIKIDWQTKKEDLLLISDDLLFKLIKNLAINIKEIAEENN